jgi:murein DD-endopeptidase MepM/ murein hydrolase activator NlpD
MCSPLEGITLAEMGAPDLLKNPFVAPRPGMDDGHHGADFAYWSRGDRKTMLGLPVYSVLNGQVAAVIHNRQPYGNAVIIETSLQSLPASFLQSLAVPTPEPTISPIPNLVCPADSTDYTRGSGRSLYLLYAHFNLDPLVQLGQVVTCGQPIGEVGTTGKSVNPHLHLETRVGPAGATFASLSHYDTSATEAERAAYCTWRVSGLFEMFDPMKLLSLQP